MFENCNPDVLWQFLLWALGALLLGYLIRFFISRSKYRDYEEKIEGLEGRIRDLEAQSQGGGSGAGTGVILGTGEGEKDALTKIEGVGAKVEQVLLDAGISSFADLAKMDAAGLRKVLDRAGEAYKDMDPTSWPRQARLAAEGKWDELHQLQEELIAGAYVGTQGAPAPGHDDLKRIEGVSYRIEGLLNQAGIHTYRDLERSDVSALKGILDAAGDRFSYINPESWPRQAGLATAGKWDELEKYQDQLMGGVFVGASGLGTAPESGPVASVEQEDLTQIEGIGRKAAGMLQGAGIYTFADLAAKTPADLRAVLDQEGGRFRFLDPTSWPQQAALARDGKWAELETLQEELIAGTFVGSKEPAPEGMDDLKRIEGIGYRVEGLLHGSGIHTYKALANTSQEDLKGIIHHAGERFKYVDPTSWTEQASLAAAGEWEALDKLQGKLISGRYPESYGLPTIEEMEGDDLKRIEGIGPKVENLLKQQGITTFQTLSQTEVGRLKEILQAAGPKYRMHRPDTWPEQAGLALAGNWEQLDTLQEELIGGVRLTPEEMQARSLGASTPKDDLKRIEGIGPKIEGLLNEAGIHTFDQLAQTDPAKLKDILGAAGERYRIHDPGTWPEQAKLAYEGNWDELDVLQEELIGGIRVTPVLAAASAKDDLKIVEGIGPKIESLLNEDGIHTWLQLSQSEIPRLQKILDEAGPRYRIHDPSTWPQQALLAHEGKWEQLEKLQDELKGGRRV